MTNGWHRKRAKTKYKVVGRRRARKFEFDGPVGNGKETQKAIRESGQEQRQV
jgi:hypothetical protein